MKTALLSVFLLLVCISESNGFTSAPLATSSITNETITAPVANSDNATSFKSIRKATEKSWAEN